MKLSDIILERVDKPKAIIMAGGAGTGKTYLLNQLDLGSLPLFNPDTYVEDPDHPYYQKLGPASNQVAKDVASAVEEKTSFVWDTTAAGVNFGKQLDKMLKVGYDVYMVMVYSHPMVSYISNFSRERATPAVAVFSTWRGVYQKIGEYDKKLKGKLSIFVNDHGGKFKDEIEAFNTAAKNGPSGISDFLYRYNEKNNTGRSSFFQPVNMSQEEEQEYNKAVGGLDYDKDNRSEDKAIKQEFLKLYKKNGVGPGQDQLKTARDKYRDRKEDADEKKTQVLDNIADMIFSPKFQDKLKHSSPKEIDQKVQAFLA